MKFTRIIYTSIVIGNTRTWPVTRFTDPHDKTHFTFINKIRPRSQPTRISYHRPLLRHDLLEIEILEKKSFKFYSASLQHSVPAES